MGKPLIYVAGPYAHPDPVLNTRQATEIGLLIYQATKCPTIVPHLSLLSHAMFPHPVEFWYEIDLAILDKCDALFRFPGESFGADAEVKFAEAKGIPVFYDLRELYNWIEDR